MTAEVAGLPAARVSSVDALRALLVAWIIGGHALLGYTAIGGWAYDEVNEVTFRPEVEYVLAALLGPSALFFMGTFFLVAGLLAPRALSRKGPRRFAVDRGVRLGLPFVVSMLVVWPLFLWLTYQAAGRDVGYWWLLTGRNRKWDSGALWFAEVLLIFSLVYVAAALRWPRALERPVRALSFGRNLLPTLAVIAVVGFGVRLWFPARATQFGDLHLWQWPLLAAMFGLGIVAARSGLIERVPARLQRQCGIVTVLTLVSLPVAAAVIGVSNVAADAPRFLGGWRWESLLLTSVEGVLAVFGSIWLLGVAQAAFGRIGLVARASVRASFAAFVLQGPVLLVVATALRPLDAPAEVKAPLAAVVGIVACFGLGWMLISRSRLGKVL